jgi:hypothetical protein
MEEAMTDKRVETQVPESARKLRIRIKMPPGFNNNGLPEGGECVSRKFLTRHLLPTAT